MRLKSVHVSNFRCLEDIDIEFAAPTALLGPNSAGKSSLLHALAFFFEGTTIEEEDVFSGDPQLTVAVECTFVDLNQGDQDAFGPYALGDQMVLRRSWKVGEKQVLTGKGRKYKAFSELREQKGTSVARVYREFRSSNEDLGLPEAKTKADVEQALLTWEQNNPEKCEEVDGDAGHLFGYGSVGNAKLSDRFPFVLVPAIRDAAEDAVERKDSLLTRLLSAVAEQRAEANEKLKAIEDGARQEYLEAIETSHAPVLDDLGGKLTTQLRRYVPNAELQLKPSPAGLTVEPPRIDLRGGEDQDLTDLGRQGHGFQRAFIISVLEYLAESAGEGQDAEKKPTLFLAIEEPELYQHPPRARHFYKTISTLAAEPSVQVCYATHSPYFVSASHFDSIAVFRREASPSQGRSSEVKMASLSDIESEMPENCKNDPRRYIERTLTERFREAFFAKAVLLLEGPSDEAVFETAAELNDLDPLAAAGVVVTSVGKGALAVARCILTHLNIPTYVVFDGDAHSTDGEKCESCGRQKTNRSSAAASNRRMLAALGANVVDFPETQVNETWACFEKCIELAIPNVDKEIGKVASEAGWSGKSPEAYAEAARRIGASGLPSAIVDILKQVEGLGN